MKLYIVGGAVRDIFLGKHPTDVDMAFDGHIDEEHFADSIQSVGKSVRVFLCQGREYMPLKGGSLMTDLHNRDLTVNAMALPVGEHINGAFYAHPLALHDLALGVLRPASDRSFFDDPLRIFRLARFAATLSRGDGTPFCVHESAIMQACAVVRQGLQGDIMAERVGRELMKALHGAWPWRFFETVHSMEALEPWFRELTPQHIAHMHRIGGASALTHWLCVCAGFACPAHRDNTESAAALAQRVCLPKKFVDGGRLMAYYHDKAVHFSSLAVHEQRDLLCCIEHAHLTHAFWHPALHPDSESALKALAHIRDVHLPEKWRNRGRRSGQYLRALQCEAVRNAIT